MSYIRDKTRPQGDRPIRTRQINYGGGLNIDLPATDIENNEVIGLENYIAFERYLEGRSGSVEVDDMPGSGDLHGRPVYHPTEKCLLFHRGSQLWRWDGNYPDALEIKSYEVSPSPAQSFGIDKTSTIRPFNDNALIFTEDGIFMLVIRGGLGKFFPINLDQPVDVEAVAAPTTELPYKYKYVYTFSLIIQDVSGNPATSGDRLTAGQTLFWESAPVLASVSPADLSYYSVRGTLNPISNINLNAVVIGPADALNLPVGHISHMSVYRTRDFGQNGLDNENDEQFAWIGDAWINPALPGGTTLNDTLTDDELEPRLRDPLTSLTTIAMSPLASGEIGEVTEGFVFAADANGEDLNYSQRVDDTKIGFHNPGFQTKKFSDGIRILAGTPDILSIICNRSTHVTTLTAFSERGGIFEAVIVLDHFDKIDTQIGVKDVGSFAEVARGTYVALCSDKSVRIWDGSGWSQDIAHDRVESIIDQAIEGHTVSVYYDGAYFLWLDLEDSGYPDTCLRLSLKRESGKGWTEYTGASWVFPPTQWGAFVSDNFETANGQDLDFMMVFDRAEDKVYWVETYDGPAGKTIGGYNLRKYYADKVASGNPNGTDILCRHKIKEQTGSQESFNLIHQQSHAYMRDLVDADKYTPGPPITYGTLKIDARAYVDGLLVSEETAGQVDPGDDIEFWYRVEGSRISIEFEASRSGHQIRGTDTRFRVQDILRPLKGASENIAATFQDEFQTSLKLWAFTRPLVWIERTANTRLSANNQTTVVGPDGRNDGLILTSDYTIGVPYSKADTTIYNAFTFNAWIKSPTLTSTAKVVIFKLNGTNSLTVTLDQSNNLSTVEFGGLLAMGDISSAAGNVSGWSQLIIVRQAGASTFNVYLNDTLKGTLPISGTAFGGVSIQLGEAI